MTRTPIPILLYHSVAGTPAAGQEAFTVTPAAFREHVLAIADSGRCALTIVELAAALRGERALPQRPVVVTFDDGFADSRPAVEVLLGAGLAATVFVTSAWIGRPAMLARAGVRELATLGGPVEVGAHSMSHPRLDELDPIVAGAEIAGSKAALEDVLGQPVASFAYPHGAHDRHVREAVIGAGFSAAAAVKNAFSHACDDPYALARLTVMATTPARHIEELLRGEGAPLAWRGERLRTRGYRGVRRFRRRLAEVTT